MDDPRNFVISSELFEYWVSDLVNKEIKIVYRGGKTHTIPIEKDNPLLNSEIAQSIFDWDNWWIITITKKSDIVITQAYNPLSAPPLRGRPTVYLDQNHWSTVAHTKLEPEKVTLQERATAANRIAGLALDAGIILPLSSAHLRETTSLFNDQRYNLGVTMARLSGGWQMRHPIQVWKSEFLEILSRKIETIKKPKPPVPVMSLEPRSMLHGTSEVRGMSPNDLELFELALADPSVNIEILINPEKIESTPMPGWAVRNQELTKHIANLNETTQSKKKKALACFWYECVTTVAPELESSSAFDPDLIMSTLESFGQEVSSKPMMSHLSYLFIQRYINRDTRWDMNDLTDMIFLSCAAGYADYVVAEKHTGNQLKQYRKSTGQPNTVFTSLEELVACLESNDVVTHTERERRSK